MKITFWLLTFFISFSSLGQTYPAPAINLEQVDRKNISRALHLLASSTASNRKQVKIAVYGQSISVQEWSKTIEAYLRATYPYADLVFKNLAIGGFSSQILHKMVHQDICAFYPDLVLFHVYGNDRFYEKIIQEIRSHTIAEVALQTDHYTGPKPWSDQMSFEIIPKLAEQYNCALIRIRQPWQEYLEANELEPGTLLKDNVHLNDYGNFLMAELIRPYLSPPPEPQPVNSALITEFKVGENLEIIDNKVDLLFYGNRVDLVFIPAEKVPDSRLQIMIDRKLPSSIPETYFQSRPQSEQGSFPWNFGTMITTNNISDWINETWQLEFHEISSPYDSFTYSITGSVTGADGSGSTLHDFVSNSGRVVIRKGEVEAGGDWHVKRSYQVLGTETKPGQSVTWENYSISKDLITDFSDPSVTAFQGKFNGEHRLQLDLDGKVPLKAIRIYRPPFEQINTLKVNDTE